MCGTEAFFVTVGAGFKAELLPTGAIYFGDELIEEELFVFWFAGPVEEGDERQS